MSIHTFTKGEPDWVPLLNANFLELMSFIVPTGAIFQYASETLTEEEQQYFLLCNGQEVSREQCANLFEKIGVLYGSGDGSTTFNLPDLRGRFPLGFDASSVIGSTGGRSSITANDLPQHSHTIPALSGTAASNGAHTHTYVLNQAAGISTSTGSAAYPATAGSSSTTNSAGAHTHSVTTTASNTGNVGSSASMDIMNPYLALAYIIKT